MSPVFPLHASYLGSIPNVPPKPFNAEPGVTSKHCQLWPFKTIKFVSSHVYDIKEKVFSGIGYRSKSSDGGMSCLFVKQEEKKERCDVCVFGGWQKSSMVEDWIASKHNFT